MVSVQPEITTAAISDDGILAARAIRDAEAFAELYRRHFTRVYRYHLAHTGYVQDAQDLTTQTFLAALEGIESFRGTGSFAAWLLGIARRKMALHYRSRRLETPLDEVDHLPDPRPLPEIAVGERMQLFRVNQALQNLASERAEALVLCIFGGLSALEAGSVMGKSEAAVKMLVYRGLKDLREKLALALQEEMR